MTNFEKIKAMSLEEFVDWLDQAGDIQGVWGDEFSNQYCQQCHNCNENYCDVHEDCKFFKGDNEPWKIPLRLWLQKEADKGDK